jgi:L-lysine exporter family protein LysE/ArgO
MSGGVGRDRLTVGVVVTSVVAGFGTSIALIAAIGAQNAFVLRQGMRREHVWAVVATCATADALLISLGVGGLGAAAAASPTVVTVARWCGAVFLVGYAVVAARRAVRPGGVEVGSGAPAALRATLLTCLAFTFLNPHVYLDTVLLIGAVASQHPSRWMFAAGAVAASGLWFTALGGGARWLAPLLSRPAGRRALDGGIAVVMAAIGISLVIT